MVARNQMIIDYLKRFSKQLDAKYLDLICSSSASQSPLFVKILLDELRITGTHEKLEHRIRFYLDAGSISNLLDRILERYQKDYDKDRPKLVEETLGLIWSARRGLSEQELLELLKPEDKPQLPHAIWNPLRSALDEFLIDKNGILNFTHDFLKSAVEKKFVPDQDKQDEFRLQLADYFEKIPITERSCDELVWILKETESLVRLKQCLLNLERFDLIYESESDNIYSYWLFTGVINDISHLYYEAAKFYTKTDKRSFGTIKEDPISSVVMMLKLPMILNRIGQFLYTCEQYDGAEKIYELALDNIQSLGIISSKKSESIFSIGIINNLALLFTSTGQYDKADHLYLKLKTLINNNDHIIEKNDKIVAIVYSNISVMFYYTNRISLAEELLTEAFDIMRRNNGINSFDYTSMSHTMACIYFITNRHQAGVTLLFEAIKIIQVNYGHNNRHLVRLYLSLAGGLVGMKIFNQAENYYLLALNELESSNGLFNNDLESALYGIAKLYLDLSRHLEAIKYFERLIFLYRSNNVEGTYLIGALNGLARSYFNTGNSQRALDVKERALNYLKKDCLQHKTSFLKLEEEIKDYMDLMNKLNMSDEEIKKHLKALLPDL